MYKVSFNDKENIVYQVMEGFIKGEEHNRAWLGAVELLSQHECKHWFIDARTQKVVTTESQLWIRDTLIPKIIEISLKFEKQLSIARIESKDLFNEASAVLFIKIVKKHQLPINYKTFVDYEEGKQWLLKV